MKNLNLILAIMMALITINANSQYTNSQGPDTGSIFVNDVSIGTFAWLNPGNAQYADGTYATCPLSESTNNSISNYLKATGFGFMIPTSATICGIIVEIKRHDYRSEERRVGKECRS